MAFNSKSKFLPAKNPECNALPPKMMPFSALFTAAKQQNKTVSMKTVRSLRWMMKSGARFKIIRQLARARLMCCLMNQSQLQ